MDNGAIVYPDLYHDIITIGPYELNDNWNTYGIMLYLLGMGCFCFVSTGNTKLIYDNIKDMAELYYF